MQEYIVIMKVGPFCGYSLEEIIQIKQEEEKDVGHFFFGYSGVFCRPDKVNRFLHQAKRKGVQRIKLLFVTTPSDFESDLPKSSEFSADGFHWNTLPKDVLLVGSKYAFVGKDLKRVDYELDISQYRVMLGYRRGKRFDEYFKFRADKGCAVLEPGDYEPKTVRIEYESVLAFPSCVLVR